ncbi:MAG: PfkB family carbohydrate kinase [Reichenbachiella sp.]|uniref:PfkB family carbohydrate kinase n=1 Tax=Reichenbachiella sp. TaxID=2184521 RepID=UPI0029674451|nr:PfkB family carbohydrate kinase [Reichenbachiella sp.]MDW3212196.1 PfkB family carbohydrate kinase [Reichenbachiella sp.]
MAKICTIGHITKDRVITRESERYMPGGTAFYFSKALNQLDNDFELITAVGSEEKNVLKQLADEGISIVALESDHTVFFENIYGENQDNREQNVLAKASPFTTMNLPKVDADYFHLGPLLNDDISLDSIKHLATKGKVSLDIQGFLRYTKNQEVLHADWKDKKEGLAYIHTLKANESETRIISGKEDFEEAAYVLADLGVKEVIITLGSHGSMIYADGEFHKIPAYAPKAIVDATGCGDTYMAGYLHKRQSGASISEAGNFGAAMATINIQSFGPFSANVSEVESLISLAEILD